MTQQGEDARGRSGSTSNKEASNKEPGHKEPSRDGHEEFVILTINAQQRLYAYILSLVFDRERAQDILQQTNLVLLEKEADFTHGTEFFAWSARVAFYEVLADRRRRSRERLLFSDELLAVVAAESSKTMANLEDRSDALRECLDKLSAANREILMRRYQPGGNVTAIAESLGKTPNAISALLHRLRSGLIDCVAHKLRAST